jgi:Integrase core domain
VHGRAARPARHRRIGYAFVHSAVDDHSRLAYSEIHDDEQATTAVGFWRRARAFYATHGITVRAVLTDIQTRCVARVRVSFGRRREDLGCRRPSAVVDDRSERAVTTPCLLITLADGATAAVGASC